MTDIDPEISAIMAERGPARTIFLTDFGDMLLSRDLAYILENCRAEDRPVIESAVNAYAARRIWGGENLTKPFRGMRPYLTRPMPLHPRVKKNKQPLIG